MRHFVVHPPPPSRQDVAGVESPSAARTSTAGATSKRPARWEDDSDSDEDGGAFAGFFSDVKNIDGSISNSSFSDDKWKRSGATGGGGGGVSGIGIKRTSNRWGDGDGDGDGGIIGKARGGGWGGDGKRRKKKERSAPAHALSVGAKGGAILCAFACFA